jgi:hypothetical protein
MSNSTRSRFQYWTRAVVLLVVTYSLVGLFVDLAVPDIFPSNALTTSIGESAKPGAFAIWFYLLWRIFNKVAGIYGPDSSDYLQEMPVWRILLDVVASYFIAIACFSVVYVYLVRRDPGAFTEVLRLSNAIYFSVVTMTTTGYGDISPKSGLARVLVSIQILFGFFYSVLFFSIFAGLAGRGRQK